MSMIKIDALADTEVRDMSLDQIRGFCKHDFLLKLEEYHKKFKDQINKEFDFTIIDGVYTGYEEKDKNYGPSNVFASARVYGTFSDNYCLHSFSLNTKDINREEIINIKECFKDGMIHKSEVKSTQGIIEKVFENNLPEYWEDTFGRGAFPYLHIIVYRCGQKEYFCYYAR